MQQCLAQTKVALTNTVESTDSVSNDGSFSGITRAEAEVLRPSGKPLSALTKTEASEWLRALGEEPRVKWTSVEIKSRVREILGLLDENDTITVDLGPSSDGPGGDGDDGEKDWP